MDKGKRTPGVQIKKNKKYEETKPQRTHRRYNEKRENKSNIQSKTNETQISKPKERNLKTT